MGQAEIQKYLKKCSGYKTVREISENIGETTKLVGVRIKTMFEHGEVLRNNVGDPYLYSRKIWGYKLK